MEINDDDREDFARRAILAIHKSRVGHAHEKVGTFDMQHERIKTAFDVALKDPDRSSAILIFALAEDLMLSAFKNYLITDVPGGWEGLINGNGLLATANDRIMLLRTLGWISAETMHDLRVLKSIRNRFAHHADVYDFTDKKMQGFVASLTPHEATAIRVIEEHTGGKFDAFSCRNLFLARSISTIISMLVDISIGPVATEYGLKDEELRMRSYESIPDNQRLAVAMQVDFVFKIIAEG